MDSKYAMIENGRKSPTSNGFQVKRKHMNGANGSPTTPKKMKSCDSKEVPKNGNYTNGSNGATQSIPVRSIQEQRAMLPVYMARDRICAEILQRNTVIMIGETGSGKTTQIPQLLLAKGLKEKGMIAVTQPRRVAAITVAKRVSQELNRQLGDVVGYTVRFEDLTSKSTKIKFMTDGCLLREALSDRLLTNYRVVVLDEAHERTIHTDVLFGIVKKAQNERMKNQMQPLKVIIMSATMDVDHFSKYFNNCKTIYLEGRTFPVKVLNTKCKQNDYAFAALVTLFEIHQKAPANHDILMFLTGQEEIDTMSAQIRQIAKSSDMKGPQLRVFPLYGQLPQNKQMDVFLTLSQGIRKVILSTNIAETSVTISGVKYVIDCGMVKRRVHDVVTGMDTLKVIRIAQDQAWQRTGRAGRESDGMCYRIYTKQEFNEMAISSTPEILRSNITSTVLQLLALGIDCKTFDFLDTPSPDAIESSLKQLQLLGAVKPHKNSELTPLGQKMSQFPLDPKFSKILLTAPTYNCLEEAICLVALLSGENIFITPTEKRIEANAAHEKFKSEYGDHITLVNVFRAFQEAEKVKFWCHENFLNTRNLVYARDVHKQLTEICNRIELPPSSCGKNMDDLRKCLIAGLFSNVAELQRDNSYLTLMNRQKALIHPSSCLHGKTRPPCVLFTEMVSTTRAFLRTVTAIEASWVQEIVPNCGYVGRMTSMTS